MSFEVVETLPNLHSTMYLFKRREVRRHDMRKLHLHSTMYLFKLLTGTDSLSIEYYLHSTMYLFKPIRQTENDAGVT